VEGGGKKTNKNLKFLKKREKKMAFMRNKITLTKKQHDDLFSMIKKDGFIIEKLPNDEFLLYSEEDVKWMFRKVKKFDDDCGKPRIELWRYMSNSINDIDKTTMVRQCYIHM